MRLARAALVVALGFFALVAQTLLFRDFLTSLEGNEIAVGAFFGSWLIWVGAGAVAGKVAIRCRPGIATRFHLLTLLYIPAFLMQHQLLCGARSILGLEPFVLVPFSSLLAVAILANGILSFVSGFLFTIACAWTSNEAVIPVARVYILETLGGFAGGLFVTILLTLGVPSEKVFLFSSVILLLPTIASFVKSRMNRTARIATGVLVVTAFLLANCFGQAWSNHADRVQWGRLLPMDTYRGSFTTAQSKFLYGEREGDFLVMAGGSVIEALPEKEHASEIAALNMAQNPNAKRVLLVGPGGLPVGERLRTLHQIEQVVWLYPDPTFPLRLLEILPDRLRKTAEKVEIPGVEVRDFLRESKEKFDLVILNLPEPTTLVLNRYYTEEFFSLLRGALAPGGVCSVRISGGSNYLGSERVLIGTSTMLTLGSVFKHVVLKPGEESFLIASEADALSESPSVLYERFASVPGSSDLYPKEGLLTLFPQERIAFQLAKYRQAASRAGEKRMLLNTDEKPKAMLFELLLSLRRAGVGSMAGWVSVLVDFGAWIFLVGAMLYGLLRLIYLKRIPRSGMRGSKRRRLRLFDMQALIFAAGIVGMATSMVLMFCYQVRFGSLFLHVGLISSLFMLGSAAGGLLSERILVRGKGEPVRLVFLATVLQLVFLAVLAASSGYDSKAGLALFFTIAGAFSGIYFPLAAHGMSEGGRSVEAAAGRLEMLDHLGGAAGAAVTGLFMLPLFGAGTSLGILAVVLAAVNLSPLGVDGPKREKIGLRGDRFDAVSRPLGYALFGVGAFFLIVSQIVRFSQSGREEAALMSAAAEMAAGAEITEEKTLLQDGERLTYYRVAEGAPGVRQDFIFPSARLTKGINGYGGEIRLAVRIHRDGALQDFRILGSKETPAYLKFIRRWMDGLKGKSLFSKEPFRDVHAVTGATMSSAALMKTLDISTKNFGFQVLGRPQEGVARTCGTRTFPWQFSGFLTLTAAAIMIRYRPGVWRRRVILALSLVLFGFVLNQQYSSQQVMSFLSLNLPGTALTMGFFLVVVLPLITSLFGNVYCGYLCPFGVLQDLLGDLRPASLATDPGKGVWRYGRFVKYVLLWLFVVLFSLTHDFSVLHADPLITIFGRARDHTVVLLVVALLVLSMVFRRFWCRNLCAAGAFLSLFNGLRLLKRFLPRTRPAACDLGVRSRLELDCLQCDRCRHENK